MNCFLNNRSMVILNSWSHPSYIKTNTHTTRYASQQMHYDRLRRSGFHYGFTFKVFHPHSLSIPYITCNKSIEAVIVQTRYILLAIVDCGMFAVFSSFSKVLYSLAALLSLAVFDQTSWKALHFEMLIFEVFLQKI